MAILVKMTREGLSSKDLATAHDGPSPGAGNILLKTPDGRETQGPAKADEIRLEIKRWEKDSLLSMKEAGLLKSGLRRTADKNEGKQEEWDTYTLSFSREESNRMTHEEMQRYAETVVSTMASGPAAGPDKYGKEYQGVRMSYMQEMHDDTNNVHFAFGIHRHAVDFKAQLDAQGYMKLDGTGRCIIDPETTASPTIRMQDKSRLSKTAQSVNDALQAAGFDPLDDTRWPDEKYPNKTVSIHQDMKGPSNEFRDAAADKLIESGMDESTLPPQLKTGTPDHSKQSTDELVNTLRSRDTDLKALDEAVKIKSLALAATLAEADKLTNEVAAINAARVAVQDKLDAMALRDAALAEKEAAEAAAREALAAKEAAEAAKAEAEAAAAAAREAQAAAEQSRDAAIEESAAKGAQIVRLTEELDEQGNLIEGLRNDYTTQTEELEGVRAELLETDQKAAAETARADGLATELADTKQTLSDALERAQADKREADDRIKALLDEMRQSREQYQAHLEAIKTAATAELRDAVREVREEMGRELVEARREANEQANQIAALREELEAIKQAPAQDAPAPDAPAGGTAGGRALKSDIEKLEQKRNENMRDLGRKAGEGGPKKDDDLSNK